MMFRFSDGSTKVLEYGAPIRGLVRRGQRPISVMFTLEDFSVAMQQEKRMAEHYLSYVKLALRDRVAA